MLSKFSVRVRHHFLRGSTAGLPSASTLQTEFPPFFFFDMGGMVSSLAVAASCCVGSCVSKVCCSCCSGEMRTSGKKAKNFYLFIQGLAIIFALTMRYWGGDQVDIMDYWSIGCTDKNSLLTDRTFLVKAPRIMQAKALLAGRTRVAAEDLRVLAMLTTFRVPPHVHSDMNEIIDEVVAALD